MKHLTKIDAYLTDKKILNKITSCVLVDYTTLSIPRTLEIFKEQYKDTYIIVYDPTLSDDWLNEYPDYPIENPNQYYMLGIGCIQQEGQAGLISVWLSSGIKLAIKAIFLEKEQKINNEFINQQLSPDATIYYSRVVDGVNKLFKIKKEVRNG